MISKNEPVKDVVWVDVISPSSAPKLLGPLGELLNAAQDILSAPSVVCASCGSEYTPESDQYVVSMQVAQHKPTSSIMGVMVKVVCMLCAAENDISVHW